MRDPYRIYAEKVLQLQPLPPIGAVADVGPQGQSHPRRRFNLFASAYPADLAGRTQRSELIADRARSFRALFGRRRRVGLLVAALRAHRALVHRRGAAACAKASCAVHAEVAAAYRFRRLHLDRPRRPHRHPWLWQGPAHRLQDRPHPDRARRSRSGLAPQLTLEAALLAEGAFEGVGIRETAELLYIKLSRRRAAGSRACPIADIDVMAKAQEHLEKFEALMRAYDDDHRMATCRAPSMEKEQDTSPFDHLSRWREWSLAEEAVVNRRLNAASYDQRRASDPHPIGLGGRQCRLRQDPCAGRPRHQADARRARRPTRSCASPSPRRRRPKWRAGCMRASAHGSALDDAELAEPYPRHGP